MSSDPGAPANPEPSKAPAASAPAKRPKISPRLRLGLLIAGGVVAVIGLVLAFHWLVRGRFIVSTDDAYLRADSVTVAPRVTGYIDAIYVKENQRVTVGQPLLHIDKRNYQDTVQQQNAGVQARTADLDAANSQLSQQQDVIAQDRAQLDSARARAKFASAQVERYRSLHEQGADTEERYAQAVSESEQAAAADKAAAASLRAAQSQVTVLTSQREQAMAQLESAKATVRTAQQNLDDTVLRASVAGTIGDDSARLGQYVQPGTRLMSVVPLQSVYLVANFKETQIRRMRVGQKATLKVDAINGPAIDARVESFAPGTGAQFALLPPENATGNFIKIVQRIPVRLTVLPPKEVADRLLPGLSVTVSVDTAARAD
jgi:membrane fusion protein (multidrug efflux system)